MKVFDSPESRRTGIAILVGLALAIVGCYLLLRVYAPFVFDTSAMRNWVAGFGAAAPLVFVFLQATQVVVAPVPGQLTALVGGYLFGALWGTVYSMIGVMIGSAVAFLLAQWFGRPLVERLLHDDIVDRFDGFVEGLGLPGLALFVVIPGLPDDAICFFAGLSHFGLPIFLGVILVARSPAYVATNFAGQGLASGAVFEAAAVLLALVFVSAVAYRNRDRIQRVVAE
jgi:uncharacterized membrane protein YdjX (TVP38/TMEM64 family)